MAASTGGTSTTGHEDFFKFPRTHHLADAGGSGVTRDDLLMTAADAVTFLGAGKVTVIAEEKLDGANLGISIDKETGAIMTQNRGHFVNSETAKQWRGLKEWLSIHRFELYDVLQPAGQHIIFGEWCYAVHSLEYKKLPDTFLVFDVYDKEAKAFMSVAARNAFLAPTTLSIVPTIVKGTFASAQDVLPLLESPSAFRQDEGKVEGVVLRVDSDAQEGGEEEGTGQLVRRAKLVRPDFVQGITEHWMSQEMRKNVIVPV